MELAAIDAFCGAGGLTYGLELAGVPVIAGIDVDEYCETPYEANTKGSFVQQDIAEMGGRDLDEIYPADSIRILVGCAPCQPFSQYTQGQDPVSDNKWKLLNDFSNLIEGTRPSIVSMENVPELVRHDVFEKFVEHLDEQGYSVWFDSIHSPKFGVPQDRNRLILLASLLGPIDFIDPLYTNPEEYPKVSDSIGGLPKISAGGCYEGDSFHRAAGLRETNLNRIRHSEPGGSWKDWPDQLKLDCHRKRSGNSYTGVYGRMRWDKPAPTITTQFYNYGSGRFGHPEQDRAISLREGALLQTFPATYRFEAPGDRIPNDVAGRLIGNAVPVELGRAIGRSIKTHLRKHISSQEVTAAG